MSALGQYSERRHEGRRTFTLYLDRVEVRGKEYLGADYETTVRLKTLAPEIDRMRTRTRTFASGRWLSFGSAVAAFILMEGFDQPALGGATSMLWTLAFCGVVVMVATWRKETYAIFKTDSGVAALSIAREGKERERFDDFVTAVQRQITVVRNSEQDASPNSRPPSPLPTSPDIHSSDTLRTPSSGGCG